MKTENANRNSERRVLKKFLCGFYKAKNKQEILQDRLQRLISGSSKEDESPDSATEIEKRIQQQIREAEASVLQIMNILELLPADSTERTIMELRHLDCKPWSKIQKTVYLTPSPCYEYYNKGLDALLAMEQVRATLGLSKNDTGG